MVCKTLIFMHLAFTTWSFSYLKEKKKKTKKITFALLFNGRLSKMAGYRRKSAAVKIADSAW